MKLSQGDLQRVLRSINQLTSDHEPDTLPERTIDSVKSLVASDVVSFEGFGTACDYQGPLWYSPAGAVSNERLQILSELVFEHPCFQDTVPQSVRRAVRVSDYQPLAKFKRTALYNEFFRQLGTDRQIVGGLHLSAELMISCSLCRLQKDYSDRDCRAFDLLTPHLVSAFRHARFANRLKFEAEQLQTALEHTKYAIITVDDNLRMQIESPTAVKLVRKYFPDDSALFLPEQLSRYIRHHLPVFQSDEFYLPPTPLEIKCRDAKLKIRLNFHSRTGTAILLLEEIAERGIADFLASGLTEREAEVIFWISQGKTDGEIAVLLRISVRTVQKHVQHIFDKLGVETRTAATAAAREPLSQSY